MFASNELKSKKKFQDLYYNKELCVLDNLILKVIIYLTGNGSNNLPLTETLDATIVTEIKNFLYEAIRLNQAYLKDKDKCNNENLKFDLIKNFSTTCDFVFFDSNKDIQTPAPLKEVFLSGIEL